MASQAVYNQEFANRVSNLCIAKYNGLPKTGKPNVNESQWTLLSGICLEEEGGHLTVVALATGTKCLGVTSYSRRGDVVHDSHAEVLTRRAWLRYLYSQMNLTLSKQTSRIFNPLPEHLIQRYQNSSLPLGKLTSGSQKEKILDELKFVLKPGVKFHFYTSHTPCGDASIFPRQIKAKSLMKIQTQTKRFKLEKDFLKRRKTGNSDRDENVEDALNVDLAGTATKKVKVETIGELLNTGFDVLETREKTSYSKTVESTYEKDASPNLGFSQTADDKEGHNTSKPDFLMKGQVCDKVSTEDGTFSMKQAQDENPTKSTCFIPSDSINSNETPRPVVDSSSEESGTEDSLSGDVGSMVQDFHRTGAKILPDSSRQDPRGNGSEFHLTGVVRTKPGRGDPTYSMSCSDKIAKWNAVGWEGTLISMLLSSPVRMSSITVGGGIAFSQEAASRALLSRVAHLVTPASALLHSDIVFPAGKRSVKREMKRLGRPISSAHPVGGCIIWCNATYKPLEIAIEGIRQGVSRKKHNQSNVNSTLLVSSYKLLLQFTQITRDPHYLNLPYSQIKLLATEYLARISRCKQALGQWLEVPHEFRQFSVKDFSEKL